MRYKVQKFEALDSCMVVQKHVRYRKKKMRNICTSVASKRSTTNAKI